MTLDVAAVAVRFVKRNIRHGNEKAKMALDRSAEVGLERPDYPQALKPS